MESAGDAASAVSSDAMNAEEFYVQDDFSAGDDQSGSGSTLADDSQASNGSVEDGDSQAGNGSAEGDDSQAGNGSTEDDAGQSGNASFTGMTDGNPSQSEEPVSYTHLDVYKRQESADSVHGRYLHRKK